MSKKTIATLCVYLMIMLPLSASSVFAQSLTISEPIPTIFTDTSTTISFNTNTPANVTVKYGTNNTMNFTVTIPDRNTAHNVDLPTEKDKEYAYQITACTAQICASSSIDTFIGGADTVPPFIDVIIPEYSNQPYVTITGKTEPYAEVQFYVNGQLSRVNTKDTTGAAGDIYVANLNLPVSDNTVRIVATDKAGNQNEETFSIIVDNTPPTITIKNFLDVSTSPNFLVSGDVNEEVNLLMYKKLNIDNTPPDRLSMVVPKTVSSSAVEIEWNPADESDFSEYIIYRDDVALGKTNTPLFTDNTVDGGASYNYRVSAMDTSCNEGQLSPTLNVLVPTGGTVNNTPTIISPTCKMPVVNVTTDGTFAHTLILEEGPMEITVIGIDKAGNKVTYTNNTYFDSVAPVIESHNLNALSPSYVDDVRVKGKVNEKAIVFVTINGKPVGSHITDEDGSFSFVLDLEREIRVDVSATVGGQVTTGVAWKNIVELEAVDQAGLRSPKVSAEVMRAICGYGNSFRITIHEVNPSSLNPRLILEGQAVIGFNVELEYVGAYDPVFTGPPEFRLRPVSQEEAKEWDMGIGQPFTQWSKDNKRGYFKFNINPPNLPQDWTFAQKEQNLSDHRKGDCLEPGLGCFRIPLELEIEFQEQRPSYGAQYTGIPSPQAENLVQKECIDVEIPMDPRVQPSEIPEAFLNSSVKAMTAAIETIDNILEPLETIFTVLMYSCLVGWGVNFFLDISQAFSCDVQQLVGQVNVEIAEAGLCEQAYGGDKGNPGKLQSCESCQSSIWNAKKFGLSMNQLCDRIYCPAAPSLKKYIKDKRREGIDVIKGKDGAPIVGKLTSFTLGSSCVAKEIDPDKQGDLKKVYETYEEHKKDEVGESSGFKGTYPVTKKWDQLTGEDFSCNGLYPQNPVCCGYEYMQEYGSACGLGNEGLFNEIKESYCLVAQNAAQSSKDIPTECKGASNIVNKISGICESAQVQGDLISTGMYYNKAAGTKPSAKAEGKSSPKGETASGKGTTGGTGTTSTTSGAIASITGAAISDITGAVGFETRSIVYSTAGDLVSTSIDLSVSDFFDSKSPSYCSLPNAIDDNQMYVHVRPVGKKGKVSVYAGYALRSHKLAKTSPTDKTVVGSVVQLIGSTGFKSIVALTDYFKDDDPTYEKGKAKGFKNKLCSCIDKQYCSDKKAKDIFEQIKSKIISPDKQYIVDPTSGFLRSLQCLCIPGVISYLQLWKNVLSAIRNCFAAILITGDGSEGVCQATISTYMCDLIWEFIRCFTQASGPGLTRPSGAIDIGDLPLLSSISKAGAATSSRVQGRYGKTSMFEAMFIDKKLVHAVCLFAFTGTWEIDAALLLDQGIATPPINSVPFLHPAQKRFISFDATNNGITTHNYHIGVGLIAGADITYDLTLICSNDYSCDPADGYEAGRCDCSYLGEEKRRPLPIPGQRGALKSGDTLSEEIFQNIVAPYRFNKVELKYSWKDAQNQLQTKSLQRNIRLKGGQAPTFCAWDIMTLSFRCTLGLEDRWTARFPRDPVPRYPGNQTYFLEGDEMIFGVPVVQTYPESKPFGCGLDCNETKYLVYEMKNRLKGTIATNYNNKCDPTVQGADASVINCNPISKEEYKLNQAGEKTIIVNAGVLTKEDFGKKATAKETTVRLPYELRAYIQSVSRGDSSISVLFQVDSAKNYKVWEVDLSKVNHDTPRGYYEIKDASISPVVSGVRLSAGDIATYEGFTIKIPDWDALYKKLIPSGLAPAKVIQLYFPPGDDTTNTGECTTYSTKPATWDANFALHDPVPYSGGFRVGPQIVYDLQNKPQQKFINFQVMCIEKPAVTPTVEPEVTPSPIIKLEGCKASEKPSSFNAKALTTARPTMEFVYTYQSRGEYNGFYEVTNNDTTDTRTWVIEIDYKGHAGRLYLISGNTVGDRIPIDSRAIRKIQEAYMPKLTYLPPSFSVDGITFLIRPDNNYKFSKDGLYIIKIHEDGRVADVWKESTKELTDKEKKLAGEWMLMGDKTYLSAVGIDPIKLRNAYINELVKLNPALASTCQKPDPYTQEQKISALIVKDYTKAIETKNLNPIYDEQKIIGFTDKKNIIDIRVWDAKGKVIGYYNPLDSSFTYKQDTPGPLTASTIEEPFWVNYDGTEYKVFKASAKNLASEGDHYAECIMECTDDYIFDISHRFGDIKNERRVTDSIWTKSETTSIPPGFKAALKKEYEKIMPLKIPRAFALTNSTGQKVMYAIRWDQIDVNGIEEYYLYDIEKVQTNEYLKYRIGQIKPDGTLGAVYKARSTYTQTGISGLDYTWGEGGSYKETDSWSDWEHGAIGAHWQINLMEQK